MSWHFVADLVSASVAGSVGIAFGQPLDTCVWEGGEAVSGVGEGAGRGGA